MKYNLKVHKLDRMLKIKLKAKPLMYQFLEFALPLPGNLCLV